MERVALLLPLSRSLTPPKGKRGGGQGKVVFTKDVGGVL